MNVPRLIAHRGYPQLYPENTLPSLEAALRLGASSVEFDIQLSADGVPMVIHDETLDRTTDAQGPVAEYLASALTGVDAGEPARLGARFRATALPTLAAVVELLLDWPGTTAFVELKRASLARFGVSQVLGRVQTVLAPIARRCVIISFEAAAVAAARAAGLRCGWVFEDWTDTSRRQARALAPDYLFSDYRCVAGTLWPGRWQWALYDIVDPQLALDWAGRGAGFIETWAVGEMLEHPLLGRGARYGSRL